MDEVAVLAGYYAKGIANNTQVRIGDDTQAELSALLQATKKGWLREELTTRPASGLKEQAQWDAWKSLGNITQAEAREEWTTGNRRLTDEMASQRHTRDRDISIANSFG